MKKAIILAAGRGERLRPFTDHTPKPLAKVKGVPLLGWHFNNLIKAGIKDVVINVCWLKNQIKNYAMMQPSGTLNIEISDEGDEALETGGGIKKALPMLGDHPFLAISADVFTDFDFRALPELAHNQLVHLILVKNPSHHPDGDFSINENNLILKSPELPSYTYSGIGIFHPDLFADKEPGSAFKIAPLIRKAIQQKRATAQIHKGSWSDVGTLERLDDLNRQQ